jgi:hypothetical protein
MAILIRPFTRREVPALPTPTKHVKGGGLCCAGLDLYLFSFFTLTHLLKFSFYDDDDLGLIRTNNNNRTAYIGMAVCGQPCAPQRRRFDAVPSAAITVDCVLLPELKLMTTTAEIQ